MFYEISQNNSGGSFDVDDKICHRLFIEADNIDDAISKAEDIGCYWDGVSSGLDCPCCGDRWSTPWDDDGLDLVKLSKSYKQKFNSIEDYAQLLADKYGWTKPDGRIFYKNGDITEIFSNRNPLP